MTTDSNVRRIAERFSRLAPEQRRAAYRKIRAEGMAMGQFPILRREAAPAGPAGRYPLSYAQSRQWFLWKLAPDDTAYHVVGALRLEGRLDEQALRASFAALVRRHESLRTVFRTSEEGQGEQCIGDGSTFEVHTADLSGLSAGDAEAATREETRRACGTPFDLATGPLLRVSLIRLAGDAHVLVVVMHHIVSDGWSMQLCVDEFWGYYSAFSQGQAPELPELPVQYADYAVWQRQWLEAGEAEHQLGYWTERLGREQPVLQLPTDHPRRADGRYRIARHRFVLPPGLGLALGRRAASEGATLFMALLAGFQVLLHRHTAQADIRVGVPIANRHRVETEGVVGFFVNTQVLRSVMTGRTPLAQVLAAARDAVLGAQAHQDLPFEQLVEALQPERNVGQSPLFQVAHNHQRDGTQEPATLPGLQMRAYEVEAQAAQFELMLDTSEDAQGGVQVVFTYAAELFEPATMARMGAHYVAVLRALAEDPGGAVEDIDVLVEPERAALSQWGVNARQAAYEAPVHRLIEAQAARAPDAVALVFGHRSLAYGELNAKANALAHHLIGLGVKPDMPVGIAVERSVEMVVGLLAIMKAGGAYVPIDPEYPHERIAYMLEDSGVKLLLTQAHLMDALPATAHVRLLTLDALDVPGRRDNPSVALNGDNLAYVIYTSGSTGRPKGAANRHRSLFNRLAWMQDAYSLGEADTVLQKTPFSFDVSVWEFFWPLMQGARLVVAPPGDHREPGKLVELIRRHEVTTIHFVPSMLQAFVAHEGIEACTSLKRIVCSGEALPAEAQARVFERLPGAGLYNLYGPTEAAIDVTHWTCQADGRNHVAIGRPISDTKTYVLDAGLNLVPQGVGGELYLGGTGLARGYLAKAALTSERFVADPFSGTGERLYRTGDLVRWREDGQLEYLGRIDHQVKIRGFRIELGEIEAQLLAQPEVREAVVIADEGPGGARLVGYVAPQVGRHLEPAELKTRLGTALPDYMIPSALVMLDALPLNANGKIDRKALPKPELGATGAYEAPQGEAETQLAAIWAEVLGAQRVGRTDSFFELGGHSLLAIQLLERMRRQGWAVEVRTLFQHPRLGEFVAAMDKGAAQIRHQVVVPANGIPAQGCDAIDPAMLTLVDLSEAQIRAIEAAVPGGARNIQDIYPLAPLQEGILFHHLMQAEGDVYVTSLLLAFDTRERLMRFIDGLNQVIARHDILRTAVLWEALPEPVQVVHRHAALAVEWQDDASGLEAGHYRIDVRRAPLLRALAAHDTPTGRWLLQLPSHHLALDHTSKEVLIEEIGAVLQGRAHRLAAPVPFRRFVAQALRGVTPAEHEAYFRRVLGDVSEPTAPFGLLDVQGDGHRMAESKLLLDAGLARQVRSQVQRQGVSAAALFHLAWGLVLARITGRDDVVFGTVLFGRMQAGEDASRGVGMFINTLPLRVRPGARSAAQCLRETHQALTELLHHEHASLSLAQRCSALPNGAPLFTALLNYRHGTNAGTQKDAQAAHGADALEGMQMLDSRESSNFPFGLSVNDMGSGFELVAQVDEAIGAARVCELMNAAVRALAQALAAGCAQPLRALDVLGESDARLLHAWGGSDARATSPLLVHQLVERQARERPDATALISGERRMSFTELDQRANRLAHRLIALGARPETRIGIALDRSLDMVVGLLGILKSGGAYVPLDPNYPTDRLAYLMEDSGIALLLSQSHVAAHMPLPAGLPVLALDACDLSAGAAHDPCVPLHAGNLAYVIYTSGSTGRPKGVAVAHGPLSMHVQTIGEAYEMTPADRELQFASIAFDGAHERTWVPLAFGAALMPRDNDIWPVERTAAEIARHGITMACFTPTYLAQMVDVLGEAGCRLPIRSYTVGGEAMPRATFDRVQAVFKPPRIINGYGPTETVITPTIAKAFAGTRFDAAYMPIGRLVGERTAYVLDDDLNRVPVGAAGELYLGGEGLARGYLRRPGLTSERFVADPFGTGYGARLYRTGDLVRWGADGQLEYLGRLDHQVKVRGFRIELGEVEAQLLAQPETREALVVAKDGPAGAWLAAYVSLQPGADIDAAALRQRLRQALPEHAVPGAVVFLDSLPLNANGKVDRHALPEPGEAGGRPHEAPQGEVEGFVAGLWAEVLGAARVGRHDNFFELGGHSLALLQVQRKVQDEFDLQLALRIFFENPTLLELAAAIGAQREASISDDAQDMARMSALLEAWEN